MIYMILAALLLALLCLWCLWVKNTSLSSRAARFAKNTVLCVGAVGAVGCAVSAVLFYTLLSARVEDSVVKAVISDCFLLFAAVDGALIFVGLLVTVSATLLKSKLSSLIPLLILLWSCLSFFWCGFCLVWSRFEDFNIAPFSVAFSIAGACLLCFGNLLLMREREKELSDRKRREAIIGARNEKRAKRLQKKTERRAVREKKRSLKRPAQK